MDQIGKFFAAKMSAKKGDEKQSAIYANQEVRKLTKTGYLTLEPAININESILATKDIPKNKAAGPDLLPAEVYARCTETHRSIAMLFNSMLEHNYIPKAVRHFFIIPLDKQGKDPTKLANKRPIALLSPLMKLLELVLVRRIIPIVETGLSEDQYAY